MDYRQYKLAWKEKGKCLLLSIGIGVVIAYLFLAGTFVDSVTICFLL